MRSKAMYVKIADGVIERYPYRIADFRRDNPGLSVPDEPDAAFLAEFGVFPVRVEKRPKNSLGELPVRDPAPTWKGGKWVVGWTIETIPATEQRIRNHAARRLRRLTDEYSPEERETWHQQVAEADALLADPDAPAVMLRALANADGISPEEMAAKVKAKADAYAAAAGTILACQRALLAMTPLPPDFEDDDYWRPQA